MLWLGYIIMEKIISIIDRLGLFRFRLREVSAKIILEIRRTSEWAERAYSSSVCIYVLARIRDGWFEGNDILSPKIMAMKVPVVSNAPL